MKLKLATGFLAAAAMVVSTAASAAMITFDLRGSGGNLGGHEQFTAGGVTMDAYSLTRSGGWNYGANLRQTSSGLGVKNNIFDSSSVDGFGTDEGIEFSFGYGVKLTGLDLSGFNPGFIDFDDYWLDVYNGGSWTNVLSSAESENLGAGYYGSKFRITARGSNDDFRVAKLTIHHERDQGPGPVAASEPATLALLGLGALALGFSRRKA